MDLAACRGVGGFVVSLFFWPHSAALHRVLLLSSFPALIAFPPARGRRAMHSRAAAKILKGAIGQYELDPGQPGMAITEAAERADNTAGMARVRIAPRWIRTRMRFCGATAFVGCVVQMLIFFVLPSDWHNFWWFVFLCAWQWVVFLPVERVRAAREVLFDAIERYEFTAEGDEGMLTDAARKVNAILRFKTLWGQKQSGVQTG